MATLRNSDYIQQIASYIAKNLQKGYTIDSLKFSLSNQGYSRTEIDRAIKIANENLARSLPKMIEKPLIKFETEPPIEEKKGFFSRILSWFSS